tara:strand:+ start:868 stop:1173 length:306 start_codon:yes stop_codon:yes gene_type:complete
LKLLASGFLTEGIKNRVFDARRKKLESLIVSYPLEAEPGNLPETRRTDRILDAIEPYYRNLTAKALDAAENRVYFAFALIIRRCVHFSEASKLEQRAKMSA